MKFVFAVSLLFVVCFAREHARYVPVDFVKHSHEPDLKQIREFRLNLVQRNIDVLEARTLDAADPDSPNYSKWLTQEEVNELVKPADADVKRVLLWLKQFNLLKIDVQVDYILCEATLAEIEKMFKAKFSVWTHEESKKVMVSTMSYVIPADLEDIVELVSGIDELWASKKLHTKPAVPLSEKRNDVSSGYIIPDTLRSLYSLPKEKFRDVSKKSSVCTAEFQDYPSFAKADLKSFEVGTGERYIRVDHIVGPYTPNNPQLESSLDIQYASALGLNSTYWFWTAPQWMLEFAQALSGKKNGPDVVSISWGWPENMQCSPAGPANCQNGMTSRQYVERVEKEWLKITSTGVTLFASSGDLGAPGDGNPACSNPSQPLSTLYPGTSTWVTSVGATMLTPNQTPSPPATAAPSPAPAAPVCSQFQCASGSQLQEEVCTYPAALITTGGGFSEWISQPAWQKHVVNKYLASGVPMPPSQYFNSSQRGFPDVAANGHAYLINENDNFMQVDGTSCSSPVWAGITALINGARINAGKNRLGHIAHSLYKANQIPKSKVFNHFHSGNNKCTESQCCQYGFTAGNSDWNPTVGLGTPNFPELLKFFLSLK